VQKAAVSVVELIAQAIAKNNPFVPFAKRTELKPDLDKLKAELAKRGVDPAVIEKIHVFPRDGPKDDPDGGWMRTAEGSIGFATIEPGANGTVAQYLISEGLLDEGIFAIEEQATAIIHERNAAKWRYEHGQPPTDEAYHEYLIQKANAIDATAEEKLEAALINRVEPMLHREVTTLPFVVTKEIAEHFPGVEAAINTEKSIAELLKLVKSDTSGKVGTIREQTAKPDNLRMPSNAKNMATPVLSPTGLMLKRGMVVPAGQESKCVTGDTLLPIIKNLPLYQDTDLSGGMPRGAGPLHEQIQAAGQFLSGSSQDQDSSASMQDRCRQETQSARPPEFQGQVPDAQADALKTRLTTQGSCENTLSLSWFKLSHSVMGVPSTDSVGQSNNKRYCAIVSHTTIISQDAPSVNAQAPPIILTRIDEVKTGDEVLSLNEKTGKLEPHRINALLDMGVKPVYKLTTASGRSIKTTANHPYLVQITPLRNTNIAQGSGQSKAVLSSRL
jgi:hypothetical protein